MFRTCATALPLHPSHRQQRRLPGTGRQRAEGRRAADGRPQRARRSRRSVQRAKWLLTSQSHSGAPMAHRSIYRRAAPLSADMFPTLAIKDI